MHARDAADTEHACAAPCLHSEESTRMCRDVGDAEEKNCLIKAFFCFLFSLHTKNILVAS